VPVIVVFQHIHDTAGWEIETGARTVADDLVRLGGLASDFADGIVGDVGGAIAEKFGMARYVGRFERRSGTAAEAVVAATAGSLLADHLAGMAGCHEASYAEPFLIRLLKRHRNEELELLERLRSLRAGEVNDEAVRDYEQALVAVAESAGVFCEVESLGAFGHRFKAELPVNWERWSLDMLERGDRYYAWGKSESRTNATPHEWQTPAALCWCLAVEHELASCLGHAVREELGVHLPPSWWFVDQRAGKVEVEANGAKVKLNEGQGPQQDRWPWQAPPLGTLRIAAEAVVKGREGARLLGAEANVGDWREFFEVCAKIGKVRNSFAHPDPESTVDAWPLRKVLIPELWKTKVMQMLVAQKPRWSGHPNLQPQVQDRLSRWVENWLG
jgi:hypothetical protein